MIGSLRKVASRVLPPAIKDMLRPPPPPPRYDKISYSQEGEDLILVALFDLNNHPGRTGFYVDIGAHHPQRVSNTHLLYLKGWSGINVDPFPGGMKLFDQIRPRDINLEVGVSAARQVLKYHIFNEPVFNGFSSESAAKYDGFHGAKLISTTDIQTLPLSELLEKHLPAGRSIDFMNVDVEGLDLEVLRSNDWARFRPSVIAVEDGDMIALAGAPDTEIVTYMRSIGYAPYCKTPLTTFYGEIGEMVPGPFGNRLSKYA